MIDLRSWSKNLVDMIDQMSWPKELNAASVRRLASLRESRSSRRWPLVGAFAIGLATGAIGFYALTKRSQIRRLAGRALRLGDEQAQLGEVEVKPIR